jgi:hypothetical protein
VDSQLRSRAYACADTATRIAEKSFARYLDFTRTGTDGLGSRWLTIRQPPLQRVAAYPSEPERRSPVPTGDSRQTALGLSQTGSCEPRLHTARPVSMRAISWPWNCSRSGASCTHAGILCRRQAQRTHTERGCHGCEMSALLRWSLHNARRRSPRDH